MNYYAIYDLEGKPFRTIQASFFEIVSDKGLIVFFNEKGDQIAVLPPTFIVIQEKETNE